MQKLSGFNTVCRWICKTPLLALLIALMLSAPSALHAQSIASSMAELAILPTQRFPTLK